MHCHLPEEDWGSQSPHFTTMKSIGLQSALTGEVIRDAPSAGSLAVRHDLGLRQPCGQKGPTALWQTIDLHASQRPGRNK
ncbi:hypothetical protein SKAU_G00022000 [Synaphobranchus kaupii]|uniref:Uncharacterized protein n=1 Tax=Synaphobranchus kaupii TaxID=118154 RepID=A0A9Q1GDW0_SYNKA|nr:hypothetical protein SKAU_G00022000 [Synaphobranchus kaupii]